MVKEIAKELYKAMRVLGGRERNIIIQRYSLNGNRKQPLDQIGKKYKICRERVRQIEKEALKKLRIELVKIHGENCMGIFCS